MDAAAPQRPRPGRRLFDRLRGHFLAGLLVAAPILVTVYICWIVIAFLNRRAEALLPAHLNLEWYLPVTIPGIAILTILAAITGVGWLAAGYLGSELVAAGQRVLRRLPLLRGIYGVAQQVAGTLLKRRDPAFQRVVMIEVPRRGVWSPGFLQAECPAIIRAAIGRPVVGVLVPRTPGMTASYVYYLPPEDVRPTGLGTEDALKLVVSAGIITPSPKGRAA